MIATSILSLIITCTPLDGSDILITLTPFSLILDRMTMTLDLDTVFHTFATCFILQSAMLLGFVLYCDCPWVVYLDIKILLFYLSVCHLAISTSLLVQLLCYEVIGLLSFRLIGHYIDRINAVRGSHIAFGVNKIADVVLACVVIRGTVAVATQ